MNKHNVIHFINVLIILILLLLLFTGRGTRHDVFGPAPTTPTPGGHVPSPSTEGSFQPVLPRLYPTDKHIMFDESPMVFPWVFTLPRATHPRPTPALPFFKGTSLSVEQQQAVFYELSYTEFKAVEDAYELDPTFGKTYLNYVSKWTGLYRDAVREKHGLNADQLEAVYREGINNRWPIYHARAVR